MNIKLQVLIESEAGETHGVRVNLDATDREAALVALNNALDAARRQVAKMLRQQEVAGA